MIVYLVWYGREIKKVFSSWEKASNFIDEQLDWIEKDSGGEWRPASDFIISAEEVR
jgi:hypothetical protein